MTQEPEIILAIRKKMLDFEVETGRKPSKIVISVLTFAILTKEIESKYRLTTCFIGSSKFIFGILLYRVIEDDVLEVC